ncbi:MAG: hypothetical protein ACP5OE_09925 [Thermodesulfobium sp.]
MSGINIDKIISDFDKIVSTQEYVSSVHRGYVLLTKNRTYFLSETQLDYEILKYEQINENGVRFFYIDVVKRKHLDESIPLPIEVLSKIRDATNNKELKMKIKRLFIKMGIRIKEK